MMAFQTSHRQILQDCANGLGTIKFLMSLSCFASLYQASFSLGDDIKGHPFILYSIIRDLTSLSLILVRPSQSTMDKILIVRMWTCVGLIPLCIDIEVLTVVFRHS